MARPARLRPLLIALALVPGTAHAARHVVVLQLVREGARGCPDEAWFRRQVAARVGFDPFQPEAPLHIEARIAAARGGLEGELELDDPQGKRLGRRTFRSAASDCEEIAASMVLAIALVVDPASPAQPPPPAPAPPPPAPIVLAPNPAPPPPLRPAPAPGVAQPPREPFALEVGLGPFASGGVSPYPTAGAAVHVDLHRSRFGAALELAADLPRSVAVGAGQVSSRVLLASLLPCARLGRLALCGKLSAGALQVTGEVVPPARRVSSPLVLAGGRLQGEFPLGRGFSVVPFGDLSAVIIRTTVLSGERPVWVTAPVAGTVGVWGALQIL